MKKCSKHFIILIMIFIPWTETVPRPLDQININLNLYEDLRDESPEGKWSMKAGSDYAIKAGSDYILNAVALKKDAIENEAITNTNMEVTEPTAVRAVAEGNAGFGQKLYTSVRKLVGGNLVMSPYSVSSVMAMASLGAKGDTLEEIREGMQFPEEKDLVAGYSNVFKVLRGNKNFTLETANQLFLQKGYHILKDFVKVMKENFYAEATQTNFAEERAARKLINDWVEQKTKEKIKDLIPKGVLTEDTKLVMVNAIYFKGDWAKKFEKKLTENADFYVEEGKVIQAKMMHNEREVKIADIKNLNAKAIELPYKGDRVSMYILLPNDKFGLGDVEMKLSKTQLDKLLAKVDKAIERKIEIFLPKFKLEKTIELKDHLQKLGMVHMFSDADFSGITGDARLYVSKVIQKAFIEVNEEGSEAAAATAIVHSNRRSARMPPPPPPKFVCDHPFIFFIKDKLTDMLLFSGRVTDPSAPFI